MCVRIVIPTVVVLVPFKDGTERRLIHQYDY